MFNDKQTAIKKNLDIYQDLENYDELFETRDIKNDVLRASIK